MSTLNTYKRSERHGSFRPEASPFHGCKSFVRHYCMLMLGKEMEIRLPGDRWGEEGFWTPDRVQNGFDVTIAEDNDIHLPLPDEFNLEEFDETESAYIDEVTRRAWANSNEGRQKRNYAHEIVILAPGDEPTMPE